MATNYDLAKTKITTVLDAFCDSCELRKPIGHFSMDGIRVGDTDTARGHGLRATCNTCRTRQEKFLFDRADVTVGTEWMSQRMCSPQDGDLFFPADAEAREEALWEPLCNACPVRAQCELYGRETGSVGVWGGTLLLGPRPRDLGRARRRLSDIPPEERGGAGKLLLKRGICSAGHEIKGPQDVQVYYNGKNGMQAACVACTAERNARSGMRVWAKGVLES